MIQQQKKKEFTELRMSDNMTLLQCVSKFIELSQLVFEFAALERMKKRRFKESLAFYI